MKRFLTRRALILCAATATLFAPALAQAPQTSPERSRRAVPVEGAPPIISANARILPAIAKNGMVVSQEARASRIGVDVLKRGGNAVDAAIATGFALAVTLPRAGNIGGGGFMLVHLAGTKQTIAIDYRETAPADTPRDVFLDAAGNFVPSRSQSSGLAVGVPGTVAGFELAHRRYGSGKLTLAELIAPAIALAREGIEVEDDLADSLPFIARRIAQYPSSRAIFLKGDAKPLERGDRLVQEDLARSLERIAASGARGFYEGETAEKLVASVREHGGRMTLEDLRTYEVKERQPVRGYFRGREIISMPPPSAGGALIAQMLNVLEGFQLREFGHNSAAAIHRMAETMKFGYADRAEHMGDPDFVRMPIGALTSRKYAEVLRGKISVERATPAAQIRALDLAPYESDQTTHFSVVDAQGNAVSNTYTLNFSYGLGLVAPGTGILLNNELDDFAAKPGAPNAYGLTGGEANAPGPRKRPLSSMSPTMVFKDGQLEIVTGSPGGSRIITIVLQVILNIVEFGMNAAEATVAPRIHHQWAPDQLRIENGISADTLALLRKMGHDVREQPTIGSAQTIHRSEGWLFGASDTRQRGGGAVGY
jgi:gamma-glutamyltranspeptidase/glutathione hydrolase